MPRAPESSDLKRIFDLRWMARTDLLWLCRNVLDYNLVNEKIHGPVIRHLQQFQMPELEVALASDQIMRGGGFRYTPWCDPYAALTGRRWRLTCDSRGYYKTSVCTIAHAIQWFLNYPHIAMGLFFASDGKAQDVLKNGIKRHFQTNAKLRELFPDYCPQKRISDWGTAEEFTLPNRDSVLQRLKLPPRVEPSIKSLSLEKSKAGYHFDIIKCSDLVDETNCLTPSQRQVVNVHFGLMPKLLVRRFDGHDGWIDVEGTFYHPQDLHNNMVNEWREKPDKRRWQVFVRGVFQRDLKKCTAVGIELRKVARYDPDEMRLPFALDSRGKRCPTWPEADTIEKLELEEQDYSEGGAVFAGQRALDFAADSTSSRPFATGCLWKDSADYALVPISYRVITIDLADTTGIKSNPSVITTAAFDRVGRCYVESIQRGKWDQNTAVKKICNTIEATQKLRLVSIEEYSYVRGLKPSLEREIALRGISPPFHYEKRDRAANGKIKRIIQSLSPPFNNGELIFIEPLALDPVEAALVRKALETEIRDCTIFSTGSTDDILDTLADIFITREWAGVNADAPNDPRVSALLQERQRQAAYQALIYPPEVDNSPARYSTGW